MKIIRGTTRIVFICSDYVVKIPNFTYSWQNFLRGIISNISENNTWRWNSGVYECGKSHLLCPVLWCSIGGWLLIMKRAERIIDVESFIITEHINTFPGDDNISNYGLLEGRIVKIDYQ